LPAYGNSSGEALYVCVREVTWRVKFFICYVSMLPDRKSVVRQKLAGGSSRFPSVNPKDEKAGTEVERGRGAPCGMGRERIH
jgi:hypothetical protein